MFDADGEPRIDLTVVNDIRVVDDKTPTAAPVLSEKLQTASPPPFRLR